MNFDKIIYLDSASTAKPCRQAIDACCDILAFNYANASSLHSFGFSAEKILESARTELSESMGVSVKEINFTSGGSQANEYAINGIARTMQKRGNRIITTKTEHKSTLSAVERLSEIGFDVQYVSVNTNGEPDLDEFRSLVDNKTILVSFCHINNETGVILSPDKISSIIKLKNSPAKFHLDCVASYLKYPLLLKQSDIDTTSVSAHKIHGTKGIGALYIKNKTKIILPFKGTEPVELAAAFAAAVRSSGSENDNCKKVLQVKNHLIKRLSNIGGILINSPENGGAYILNISIPDYNSETMMHWLAQKNIFVSAGSACSKGKASHVLTAMGLSKKTVESALRISFDKNSTISDVDIFADAIIEMKEKLIKRKKFEN